MKIIDLADEIHECIAAAEKSPYAAAFTIDGHLANIRKADMLQIDEEEQPRYWIPINIPNPEKLPFNEFGSLVMSAVAQWLCQVKPEIVGGTGVLLHHASVGLDPKATIAFSHLQTGKVDPDIDRLRLLDLTVKLLGWQFTEVKERVTAEADRGVGLLKERIALAELAKAAEKQ